MVKLGDKVKDKISGYTGIVVAITEHLQGCRTVGVRTQKLHDGKPIGAQWFDEPQLTVVKQRRRVVRKQRTTTGGPRITPARKANPVI